MATEVHDTVSGGLAGEILNGMVAASNFSTNTNQIGADPSYFVIDGSGEDSYKFEFNTDYTSMTVTAGLNWVEDDPDTGDKVQDWVYPDSYNADECNQPSFPGSVWSDSTSLQYDSNTPASIWRGSGWIVIHPYASWNTIQMGLANLGTSPNYQSFSEEVQCTDSEGNDYTSFETGYNPAMYSAFLKLGGSWYDQTWGTTSGNDYDQDISSRLEGQRLPENTYERDDSWTLTNDYVGTAGEHDKWVDVSQKGPRMGHEGTMTASGTYITLIPQDNNCLFKD
jgi:hypothetical protein